MLSVQVLARYSVFLLADANFFAPFCPQWATSVALSVEASQTTCSFLPYGHSFTINITYSNNPLEGLQVCRT